MFRTVDYFILGISLVVFKSEVTEILRPWSSPDAFAIGFNKVFGWQDSLKIIEGLFELKSNYKLGDALIHFFGAVFHDFRGAQLGSETNWSFSCFASVLRSVVSRTYCILTLLRQLNKSRVNNGQDCIKAHIILQPLIAISILRL